MARNYRAEYQARVARGRAQAAALGVPFKTRMATGHAKPGEMGSRQLAAVYKVKRGSPAQQDQSAKDLRTMFKGVPREQLPAWVEQQFGPDYARIVYGGSP